MKFDSHGVERLRVRPHRALLANRSSPAEYGNRESVGQSAEAEIILDRRAAVKHVFTAIAENGPVDYLVERGAKRSVPYHSATNKRNGALYGQAFAVGPAIPFT